MRISLSVYFLCQWALMAPTSSAAEWSTWTPREEISPQFEQKTEGNAPRLVIRQDTRDGLEGAWLKNFAVQGGQHYRFSVNCELLQVAEPLSSAYVEVRWAGAAGEAVQLKDDTRFAQPDLLSERTRQGNVYTMTNVLLAPPDAVQVRVGLHFRWAAGGTAIWSDIEVNSTAPVSRLARLASVHVRPKGKTAEAVYREFQPLIEMAAASKADLIVLPEMINYFGKLGKQPVENAAETIPGPATDFFSKLASKHNCYIVVPIFERDGHLIFNSAAIVGPEGTVLGKYRKVCIPRNEVPGICAGTEYPVFQTRFGTVGIMICWEVHFPEVAQRLAENGAEVIVMPTRGGVPDLAKARAIENQIYLVSSTYNDAARHWMISGVWGPDGTILAQAKEFGSIAIVELDLNKHPLAWNDIGNFKAQIPVERPRKSSNELSRGAFKGNE